jgi:hypothetical protein
MTKKPLGEDIRLTVRVTPEMHEQLNSMARDMSITKMSLAGMLLNVGFGQVSRLLKPEAFLDWEKVSQVFGNQKALDEIDKLQEQD